MLLTGESVMACDDEVSRGRWIRRRLALFGGDAILPPMWEET